MPLRSVVVLGGGPAGLAAALALGRRGHRVTVVERDPMPVGEPAAAPDWPRRGIPHFLQAHAFLPRARKEMRMHFPDVFTRLVDAGAWDLDLRPKIRGQARPGDEVFAYLAARRPLMEWALRSAVAEEPTVTVLSETTAIGLDAVPATTGERPRISGVTTSAGTIAADLVVDAMGRRTPTPGWIAALGAEPPAERSTDCGIVYYTRYHRLRPGATLADGPWLPTPRADLGYAAFSTFPGDNGTFAAIFGTPPGDQELKSLRHAAAFEAAAAAMPALHLWTSPDVSEPITDVLPMGSLRNTLRIPDDDTPLAVGLVGVADAICHTNPIYSLGLCFALIHAVALADAVDRHGSDADDVGRAFLAATRPEMEERFRFASEVDALRARAWAGEPVDVAHRDGGAYPLFTIAAGSAAALADGEIFRPVVGRNTFLLPLGVLDDDEALQRRIEETFAQVAATPRPRPGPAREELLGIIRAALPA